MMMTEGNQSKIYGSSRKICVFAYKIICCSSTIAQIVETEKLILEMERNEEILASKLVFPICGSWAPIKMLFSFFDGQS